MVSPGPFTDVTARHGADALAIPHQGWHHKQRPGVKKSESSLGDLEVKQGAQGEEEGQLQMVGHLVSPTTRVQ